MRKLVPLLIAACRFRVLSACQSTSINSAWFDPNFKGGPMKKIDVVGAGTNLSNRRVAEDIFAQKLRDAGVEGVAGWTVIPDEARAAQGRSPMPSRAPARRACWSSGCWVWTRARR